MTSHTLTIDFPDAAAIPSNLGIHQDLLRYAIAGALIAQGLLTKDEARRLTGDSPSVFAEKLRAYGFSPVPKRASGVRREGKKSRWALAVDHFEKAGHLDGRSDEVKAYIREFRRSFSL